MSSARKRISGAELSVAYDNRNFAGQEFCINTYSHVANLIDNMMKYANEVLAEKIPKEYYNKHLVETPSIQVPHYAKNCIAIIERAYNNPEWYIDVLRNVDFIMFEFMLKHKKFDDELFSKYCKNYLVNEKLKACKNVLIFICSASALYLGEVWEEEKEFIPQKVYVEK